MVECLLRMQKVLGSNPSSSIFFFLFNRQNSYVAIVVIISQWAATTLLQRVGSLLGKQRIPVSAV